MRLDPSLWTPWHRIFYANVSGFRTEFLGRGEHRSEALCTRFVSVFEQLLSVARALGSFVFVFSCRMSYNCIIIARGPPCHGHILDVDISSC